MVLVKNKLGEDVEFVGTKLKANEEKNVNIKGFKRDGKIVLVSMEDQDSYEMSDDYLDQNARTVRKSIRNDDLSEGVLKNLLETEKKGKNRKTVKKEIKKRLD